MQLKRILYPWCASVTAMYLPFFVFGGVLSRPDCTIYSAFLQLPYTRIISRPLLSFFVISSTTTTIFFPIARFEIESFFLTASRHFFHHCHLITNNPLIPILILRILAQPLWRSVSLLYGNQNLLGNFPNHHHHEWASHESTSCQVPS